ncbi:hypothetical protein GCM10028812_48900 [Ancylobacter sonchi]
MAIEGAVGQAACLHDLGNPDIAEAALPKQPRGGIEDCAPMLGDLFPGNTQFNFTSVGCADPAGSARSL